MARKKNGNNARYIRHTSTTRVETVNFLRIGRYEDDQDPLYDINDVLEDGSLKTGILDRIYHGYREEYKNSIKARTTWPQRFWRHGKAFFKHESYAVDPHSLPPVRAVVIRLQDAGGVDSNYVNQVYREACLDGIRRAETSSEKWNKVKEFANIALPIPLGLAAFFTGYLTGSDGVGWAAVAEFGPYALLPLAVWARQKEYAKRHELEQGDSKSDKQAEELRASMERCNAIKDGASFVAPVVFDAAMMGLSRSGVIPTSPAYMGGIVTAPYAAHFAGFLSMLAEYRRDERAAILRKMRDTKVIIADSRTPTEQIVGRYL